MSVADDVILTSHCRAGLQKQIDILKHSAGSFSVTITLIKTKIAVFRRGKKGAGGFLAANEVWRYGDQNIQVVNRYKYLGFYFTTRYKYLGFYFTTRHKYLGFYFATTSPPNCL